MTRLSQYMQKQTITVAILRFTTSHTDLERSIFKEKFLRAGEREREHEKCVSECEDEVKYVIPQTTQPLDFLWSYFSMEIKLAIILFVFYHLKPLLSIYISTTTKTPGICSYEFGPQYHLSKCDAQ